MLFLGYYWNMLDFFKNLFAPKPKALPDSLRPELYWEIPLEDTTAVFPITDTDTFSIAYRDSGIQLIAKKPNKFIWQEMPGKLFSDFMLDTDIILPTNILKHSDAMHYAVGIVFRMSDNETFMFVGISDTGYARLDCLLNGEPQALTGWVECPWLEGNLVNIILIARGTHYSVFLNGQFALEAEDDTVRDGNLAVALQVYAASTPITVRFTNMTMESRPLEVEVAYSRFTNFLANQHIDQRRRLVDSFMSIQSWIPALIQIKRIEEHGTLHDLDKFNRAECYIREFLYKEALNELMTISKTYADYDTVKLEMYNLLYIQGQYLELKEKLLSDGDFTNPLHCNLLGHAFFNLGDYNQAIEWYEKAFLLEPTMPLYAQNAARSAEYAEDYERAVLLWNKAAHEFYKQEAYEDTKVCIHHLKRLHADLTYLLALEARIAYAEQDLKLAESLLKKLESHNKLDAGSAYLLGMIIKPKQPEAALAYFKQAIELEPETALYHFRYTETLWITGKPYDEALQNAMQFADTYGWIYNLAGQIAEAQGKDTEAVAYYEKAVTMLEKELVPRINLATALNKLGYAEKALNTLANHDDKPELLNALGNLYAANHQPDTALSYYEQALTTTTKTNELYYDILFNKASCLISLEQWADAQDTVRIILEHNPKDIKSLLIMGDIWEQLGDYVRAELSWNHALELSDDVLLLERLGMLYIKLNKPKKLHKILEKLESLQANSLKSRLAALYDSTIHTTLTCTACGKLWKIPRILPHAMPPLKLHGEIPDYLPAGVCPSCNARYCVQCAKENLDGGRFVCPTCKVRLSINDPQILWIFHNWKKNSNHNF